MSKYLDLSIKEINELLKKKEIKPVDLVNEGMITKEGNHILINEEQYHKIKESLAKILSEDI